MQVFVNYIKIDITADYVKLWMIDFIEGKQGTISMENILWKNEGKVPRCNNFMVGGGARWHEQVSHQPWFNANIVLSMTGHGLVPPHLDMPLNSGLASGPSRVQHLSTPLYQFTGLNYHSNQSEYTKTTFPEGPTQKIV